MSQRIQIEYSIVSRGTERYNNHGYMAISEKIGKKRYIMNLDHGIQESEILSGSLCTKKENSIENIAFSRFQLIGALAIDRYYKILKDKILILGIGAIGLTSLFYLLTKNFKIIDVYCRNVSKKEKNLQNRIEEQYNIKINFITNLDNIDMYQTIIDTTGSSSILETIFNNAVSNQTILILSTPREETFKISPLMINRKNLTILGSHELIGVNPILRKRTLTKLLKQNSNKTYLKEFVSIYPYSKEKLEDIKNQKKNYIEMFKY